MEAIVETGATLDSQDDNLISMLKYVGDRDGFTEIVNKLVASITNKVSDESKPLEASSLEAKLSKGKILVLGTVNGRVIQEIWWVKNWSKFKHPLAKPEDSKLVKEEDDKETPTTI